jgi:urease accessory protein UreE
MIRLTSIVTGELTPAQRAAAVTLVLPYDERVRQRLATVVADGPRAAARWRCCLMRRAAACCVTAPCSPGPTARLAIVRAAPQPVSRVTAPDALTLLRAVYHLANRHVPAQLALDAVLIEAIRCWSGCSWRSARRWRTSKRRSIRSPAPITTAIATTASARRSRRARSASNCRSPRIARGQTPHEAAGRRPRPRQPPAPAARGAAAGQPGPAGGRLCLFAGAGAGDRRPASCTDAASAQRWIDDLLRLSLARLEAPLWLRAFDACARDDAAEFARWNDELIASRETAELRAESLQMGASLARLLPALGLRRRR